MILLALACTDYEINGQEEVPPGAGPDPLPSIEVSPSSADFGGVELGASGAAQVFTVRNVGEAPLALSGVQIAQEGPFDVFFSGAPQLEAGESVDFSVTFAPEGRGLAVGAVQVGSDDPETPVVELPLTGSGLAPDIEITPSFYDFGTLEYGATASTAITITNVGDAPLDISALEYVASSAELSLDRLESVYGPLPWSVGPGGSVALLVNYAPTDDQADEGALTVISDDPDETVAGAQQVGNARAWEGFSTGWYIVDDSTNYETTSNASYRVESHGDPDGYWYEPSGAHGMVGSTDIAKDFDTLHDYVMARAGAPTAVSGPLNFRTSSSVPSLTYASYSYVLCDFWIEKDDDPYLYEVRNGSVDDGLRVIVNGQVMADYKLGSGGSVNIGSALTPGAVNTLVVILMDNAQVDKYVYDLAFVRDGVVVGS